MSKKLKNQTCFMIQWAYKFLTVGSSQINVPCFVTKESCLMDIHNDVVNDCHVEGGPSLVKVLCFVSSPLSLVIVTNARYLATKNLRHSTISDIASHRESTIDGIAFEVEGKALRKDLDY